MLQLVDDKREIKPSTYRGTPWECLAFLDSYYRIQRAFLKGMGSDDKVMERYDRTVFEVTVTPLDMISSAESRPETVQRVERLKTALDIFDTLIDAKDSM